MKIIKLILSKNKRLSLKHIEYIEINPTDPVQLILGTNGVGKSSVIFECTPLPANAHDYHKDGYKEIHLEHKGSYFICKSTFDPKQRHSITENGVELNDGGTVSVQKEIILHKFGITQEIHEILTMQTRFTSMPKAARRYWLTKLANSDYNYVIGVYNKLKSKYQDISGTIKTLKKRLVLETEKIVDIDYQNSLQKEVDTLHTSLSELLEIRKPQEETPEQMVQYEKENSKKLIDISNQLIRSILSNRKITSITFDDIEHGINEAIINARTGATLSDQYLVEIVKLDESISVLEKTGQNNVQDLLSKILRLQLLQEEILAQTNIEIDTGLDPSQLQLAATSVEATLHDLAINLPSNSERQFSRNTYSANTAIINNLIETKARIEIDLNDLQARKKHQEIHLNTDGVQCPQCSFKWHLGYSENAHKEVIAQIEEKSQALAEINKALEVAQQKSADILEYFAQFKKYTQLVDNWPILKNLWEYFDKMQTILNSPSNIPFVLDKFSKAVQLKGEYDNYQRQIDEAKNLIDMSEKVLHLDINKLKEQRIDLDSKLFAVSQQINAARSSQNEYQKLKMDKTTVDKLSDSVQKLIQERQHIQDKTVESVRRKLFNECVRNLQTTLSRKELAISEIRGQRAIITDIENQIFLLTADEQALKLLVDQLSPTDGLIAEGIFGFIKVFVSQWNSYIKRVWSYPLVIQACSMDDGSGVDLDYEFPVDNGQTTTPDVSRCSAGQKEMINLGFLVLFMKHLGFGEFPLMLDEFAVNLDNAHRITATNFIKDLIEKHSFTQLFMVNHYDSIYGAFTNSQVTVMCEENVILPKDCVFNQHAIIR